MIGSAKRGEVIEVAAIALEPGQPRRLGILAPPLFLDLRLVVARAGR